MSATAILSNGKVLQGHQDGFNTGIIETTGVDLGDRVVIELPAPATDAASTGGPFFQVTRFLRALGDQLFRAPAADCEVIEASDSDYSSYGPCCCC